MHRILLATLIAALPLAATSDTGQHGAQPYAGMEGRDIKSLSAQDIAELEAGGGWGLALPAELNGLPGPRHLLEHKDALGLAPEQVTAIEDMFEAMRADAIAAGQRFIAAEAALSDAFAKPAMNPEDLQTLLQDAAEARSALRFVHLSRHLATPDLLTKDQIRKYAVLRGYSDDVCANVPEGHDATMWRKHNGCD
jgi:hypothetical protein